MATDAMKSQVAAKWQEAFQRLNGDAPGISGLMKFAEAWAISVQFLYPWDISSAPVDADGRRPYGKDLDAALPAFNLVKHSKKLPALVENFLDDVRKNFYLIEIEINRYMARYEENQSADEIRALISRLVEWYKAWAPPQELGPTVFQTYTLNFQTRLFSALPPSFTQGFKDLCSTLLLPPSDLSEDQTPADVSLDDASFNTTAQPPPPPPNQLHPPNPTTHILTWKNIDLLGLLERYETIVASVGYEYIEAHVLRTCSGEWGRPVLEELRVWMSRRVVPWLLCVYARGAGTAEEARTMLQGVGSRFDFHINKTLCDLRTREIFDIIIDYPDSMGALQDLRDCLQRVDQRANLVTSLRKQNFKRLLHPGADTKLILQQYVSTIRCLRIIDPPGVLLFKVADPIRRYLRERPDTIRSIVANLVGGDGGDGDGDGDGEGELALVDDADAVLPIQQHDVDDYSDPNWEPEPVDAGPEFRTNKPSDVISTLVSIYDSKDLFVKELQVLLAQRLLMMSKGGGGGLDRVERERKNIEILKIRFGEAALQVCEVMLRDMTDSKRIDAHVQAQKSSTLHPTIISRHFWPALESSDLVMPGQFRKMQDAYAHEYTVFKPDKKLKWLPHLGTVSLELELADRKVVVDVPPLEAAFMELFSERAVWMLDDLVGAVGSVDRAAAIKALSTWVDLGVLEEDPENTFNLLERVEKEGRSGAGKGVGKSRERDAVRPAPAPDETTLSGAQLQQAEQMRVYWKFIEGMLTNLGSLPLDRIQSMLKFAPGYDKSVEQLAAFLEAARREKHVLVRDGMWKLNPNRGKE